MIYTETTRQRRGKLTIESWPFLRMLCRLFFSSNCFVALSSTQFSRSVFFRISIHKFYEKNDNKNQILMKILEAKIEFLPFRPHSVF